ncbi:MAG: 30S ribosomal protein S27ae [archaeon]|nr:30S ribosomal protein S27ae [archaeon]
MAKKETSKNSVKKSNAYDIKGDSLTRIKTACPKCGPGIFMATHKNRVSCGKCGYTQFNKE